MRAAVYRGDGKLVAEEWPRPAIGDGEVLLRLLGCGLCGSDIAKVMDPTTPAPLVLGHEVVGEVVRLGAGVTSCGIGDTLSLRLETLYHRELTLTATYSSSPSDLAEAFRLIVAGEVSVDRLVTHRVSPGDLDRGGDLMRRREALKVYGAP